MVSFIKKVALKLLSFIIGNSWIISSVLDGAYTDPKWNSRRLEIQSAVWFFSFLYKFQSNVKWFFFQAAVECKSYIFFAEKT